MIRILTYADLRSSLERFARLDVLVAASLTWFMVQFLRYLFPPLFETLQGQYGVSNTEVGVLFTALMLGYAAMQFPSGLLSDRFGTAAVIAGGLVVSGLASLLVSVADSFGLLLVGAGLVGVGTGTYKTVGINLLTVVYDRRTGFTLGVMDAVGMFGGVVAPPVVVLVLASRLDWQAAFVGSAVVCFALAAAFYRRTTRRLARDRGRDDPGEPAAAADDDPEAAGNADVSVLARPRFLGFVVLSAVFAFAWSGLSSFLPLYLTNAKGLSAGAAGFVYSGLFVVGLVQVLTGELSDRVGQLRIVVATTVLVGAASVLLLVAASPLVIAGLVLALGAGFHGMRPARDAYLMRLIPRAVGGRVLGLVRTALAVVSASAPTVVGYVSDVADLGVAFAVVAGSVLACAVLGAVLVAAEPG